MIVKSQKSCNFCVTPSWMKAASHAYNNYIYDVVTCVRFIFSNRLRLCAVLLTNDDDVLVLPCAVSTPVDDSPYFFNVGSWLVNLPTMVSLSDWRESFYFISFVLVWLFHFFSGSIQAVYIKSMYSGPTISCVNRVKRWSVICPKHAFMPCICIFIIALLLIVSGNVELNPRPMKKCPKCEKMRPTRSNNCRCGHLLCYVAASVLHFSAFICIANTYI